MPQHCVYLYILFVSWHVKSAHLTTSYHNTQKPAEGCSQTTELHTNRATFGIPGFTPHASGPTWIVGSPFCMSCTEFECLFPPSIQHTSQNPDTKACMLSSSTVQFCELNQQEGSCSAVYTCKHERNRRGVKLVVQLRTSCEMALTDRYRAHCSSCHRQFTFFSWMSAVPSAQ